MITEMNTDDNKSDHRQQQKWPLMTTKLITENTPKDHRRPQNRVKSRENTFQAEKHSSQGNILKAEKHFFQKLVQIAWNVDKTVFRAEKHFF